MPKGLIQRSFFKLTFNFQFLCLDPCFHEHSHFQNISLIRKCTASPAACCLPWFGTRTPWRRWSPDRPRGSHPARCPTWWTSARGQSSARSKICSAKVSAVSWGKSWLLTTRDMRNKERLTRKHGRSLEATVNTLKTSLNETQWLWPSCLGLLRWFWVIFSNDPAIPKKYVQKWSKSTLNKVTCFQGDRHGKNILHEVTQ